MGDRRDPGRQQPDPKGERASDPVDGPWLNTAQCAARLGGVTPAFIVGEIREGRLLARIVLQRPHKRTIYRILESDLALYMRQYNWSARTAPTVPTASKRSTR